MGMNWNYLPPPPPQLNGGWYTGTPFPENAPWRNVVVTPDVSYMIHTNLLSANPPPGASQQYPTSYRPGNNAPVMTGTQSYGPSNDMMCIRRDKIVTNAPKFAKYASW